MILSESGFSLTFEVEGHWLVSRQVLCKTEGQRPEPLGVRGHAAPENFENLHVSLPGVHFPAMWERNLCFVITYT